MLVAMELMQTIAEMRMQIKIPKSKSGYKILTSKDRRDASKITEGQQTFSR